MSQLKRILTAFAISLKETINTVISKSTVVCHGYGKSWWYLAALTILIKG